MPVLNTILELSARSLHELLPRKEDDPPLRASHPSGTHMGHSNDKKGGISKVGIAVIVLLVLLIIAFAAYIVLITLRSRRLGLPAPTWRTFVPFLARNRRTTAAVHSYEPTRPTGGVLGRVKGVFGGNSSGGYSGTQTRSTRTRAMDPDGHAWDARLDDNDEELGYRGAADRGRYDGYEAPVEMERGRSRSRDPPRVAPPSAAATPYPGEDSPAIPTGPNPFDRDVARVKADGFGDVGVRGGRGSTDSERRSVFKEGI